MAANILDKASLKQIFDKFYEKANVAGEADHIKCFFNKCPIWEYKIRTNELKIETSSGYSNHVMDALNICGAFDISVSFKDESRNLSSNDWDIWFLKKIKDHFLILDTNFLLRHYYSNVLKPRISNSQLKEIDFYLPNMVILEIERIGNAEERIRKKEQKKDKSIGHIEGISKRMAFYGIKEIQAIKQNSKFYMIPLSPTIKEFTQYTGSGLADAMIRQEIHDGIDGFSNADTAIFVTCDLMNSMAAEAEGLSSCYFNRLPFKSVYLDKYSDQILEFVVASAILFERISFDFLKRDGSVVQSYNLEGVWEGKTTSEWYSDSLRQLR